MRAEQITSPSLAWLLPSPLFWKPDEVLVQTQSRAYTFAQLEDFFMYVMGNCYTQLEFHFVLSISVILNIQMVGK